MRRYSKRTTAAVAAMTLTASGIAFAYWSAGGSGSGTAATGTNVAITAVQTGSLTAMAPGVAAQTLSGTFDNPNPGPVFVNTVTASISGVTKAPGAPAGNCDASDYTLVNPVMTVAKQVPAGSAQGSWSGASLAFDNKSAVLQDACKGATVALAYSIA